MTRITSPKDALPLYERDHRAQPRHNDAWLGQGICLTYLERPKEAIAALTASSENWALGRRRRALLARLEPPHPRRCSRPPGRTSTRRAEILYNTDVYALADASPTSARSSIRPGRCSNGTRDSTAETAAPRGSSGSFTARQERWLDGAGVFEQAETCYQNAIDSSRGARRPARDRRGGARRPRQQGGGLDPPRRAPGRAAAYNAAFACVRGGDKDRAARCSIAPSCTRRWQRTARELRRSSIASRPPIGGPTAGDRPRHGNAASDGAHSQTTSLVSTSTPRREKNDQTPIGDTSIGRAGKCQRVSTNGAKKATPRPPLVKASRSPCEAAARASTSHSHHRDSAGREGIASVATAASAAAAGSEWLGRDVRAGDRAPSRRPGRRRRDRARRPAPRRARRGWRAASTRRRRPASRPRWRARRPTARLSESSAGRTLMRRDERLPARTPAGRWPRTRRRPAPDCCSGPIRPAPRPPLVPRARRARRRRDRPAACRAGRA